MRTVYKTVSKQVSNQIMIEKSRFIAYVSKAETDVEAISFIDSIKKKHWDATHNCSAYLIGDQDQIQKAHDDGEPSGTAGKPMLEILKKMEIKDTVVVVTRYFGGVKLGAGGLIHAYGQATKEGVLAAGVVERVLHKEIILTVDYTWHGKVENEMKLRGYTTSDIQFAENVKMTLLAVEGEEDQLIEILTNITNGQSSITEGESIYVEKLVEVN
jgi:uncharacterized YigZ family protein